MLDESRVEKKNFLRIRIFDVNRYSSELAKKYNFQVIDLHYLVRHQVEHRCKDGMHYDAFVHRQISTYIARYIACGFRQSAPKSQEHHEDIQWICHELICSLVEKCDEQINADHQRIINEYFHSDLYHEPIENFDEKEKCLLYLMDHYENNHH